MDNNFELITLTTKYKHQYLKMIEENAEDLKKTGFYYRFPLSTEETFEKDIEMLSNRSKGIDLPEGKVPDSTFFLFDKKGNKIVAGVNIRHSLNTYHYRRGGHIGYYVCPLERNKGYSKIILEQALDYCKNLGIEKVLLTCLKDNIVSAKTIISYGGVFEQEVEDNGDLLQRYWISL